MMNRRTFLCGFTLGTLSAPLWARAEQSSTAPQIGLLIGGSASASSARVEAFRRGLRDLGYAEGENITLAYRYAAEKYNRLPGFATELIQLKVNVLVAAGTPASFAAKRLTDTIPIVVVEVGDPMGSGLVTSLARPGGNITGLSALGTEIYGKQVEILKEALRELSRAALLWNSANPFEHTVLKEVQAAARAQGITVHPLSIQSPNDFENAFATAARERASALIVTGDFLFVNHRARIAELAAKHRLPAMYRYREFVNAGGLVAYGPDPLEMYRRAAYFVDRILKGAKPADLPVEQPTKFELVINLKTAKALGLTISESILLRADEVIR